MSSFGTQSSAALWIRRLALAGARAVLRRGGARRLRAAHRRRPRLPGLARLLRPPHAHRRRAERSCAGGVSEHAAARRQGVARDDPSLRRLDARPDHRVITALAITTREQRIVSIPLAVSLLVTVVVQGMLGMLTVTWQLKPLIVTLHLLFGLTTLCLLWWLCLSLRSASRGGMRFGAARRLDAARTRRATVPPHRCAGRARSRSACRSRWAAGPAATTPPSRARTFPKCQQQLAAGNGLRGRLRALARSGRELRRRRASAPGARGHSLHPSARRAGRDAWRSSSRPSRRCGAEAVVRRCTGGRVRGTGRLVLQLFIGASMVLEVSRSALATAHNAGAALLLLASLPCIGPLRQSLSRQRT